MVLTQMEEMVGMRLDDFGPPFSPLGVWNGACRLEMHKAGLDLLEKSYSEKTNDDSPSHQ